jgi:hypothetical protein
VTDGGGVRGLTTLLVLEQIFESIKNEGSLPETPKPCEYFDMIGGTSTGGYVTTLLFLVLDATKRTNYILKADRYHAGTTRNVNQRMYTYVQDNVSRHFHIELEANTGNQAYHFYIWKLPVQGEGSQRCSEEAATRKGVL